MDTPNEERSPVADDGLENLPEAARKETESILDEMKKEAAPAEEAPKPDPAVPPKPDAPAETPAAPDQKPPEGERPPEPEKRREVKLMPTWQHEAAMAKAAKELDAKIAAAVEEAKKSVTQPPAPDGVLPDIETEAKAIAEKTGVDIEVAKAVLESATRLQGKVPEEVTRGLEELAHLKREREIEAESAKFTADFDRLIVPLIKAEYGEDTPPEHISDIREKMKELAYSDSYGKVPYQTIYKGEDQFRNLIPVPTRGAEPTRPSGVDRASIGEELDLTKPLSDEAIKGLSSEQFDQYEKNMVAFEKSQGK